MEFTRLKTAFAAALTLAAAIIHAPGVDAQSGMFWNSGLKNSGGDTSASDLNALRDFTNAHRPRPTSAMQTVQQYLPNAQTGLPFAVETKPTDKASQIRSEYAAAQAVMDWLENPTQGNHVFANYMLAKAPSELIYARILKIDPTDAKSVQLEKFNMQMNIQNLENQARRWNVSLELKAGAKGGKISTAPKTPKF